MAERTQTQVLFEMVESLTQAIGSASQLVHLAGDPMGFIMIRDVLAGVKDGVIKLTPENQALVPRKVIV